MSVPFQNARVVSWETDPSEYCAEISDRGTPAFTMHSHAITEFLHNAHRWVNGYKSPESAAKEWGERLDCRLLTPRRFKQAYVLLPGDAPRRPSERQRNAKKPSPETVAAVAWWDKWNKEHEGAETLEPETYFALEQAAETLLSYEDIASLLQTSRCQCWVTGEYHDRATGMVVPVKGLIDLVPDKDHPVYGSCLADLKTTKTAQPERFVRDFYRYGYHVQAALYLDLWQSATGEERTDFVHVIQESFAPYESRMPYVGQKFLSLGRVAYHAALESYCRCLKTGVWPSYDKPGTTPITEPEPWMLDFANIYDEMDEEEETPKPPSREIEDIYA